MEKYILIEDGEMLVRLKSGEVKAFDFFYKKYRSRIYANILKLTKSTEIAADILQEVFVSVWNNRETLDPGKPFDHYLYKIAQNKAYDFFRKVARDKKLTEKLIALSVGYEYNPVEDDLHRKEDFEILANEINQLPPKCKEVFKLCKIDGKSYQEVADLLNISTATVNNHIVKATRILKKGLSNTDLMTLLVLFCFYKK